MKQLLFLLLFPCLSMAQYQGNGNQKITLGEQTTADGLVYRGLAADTTRKPSVDTMAFILLDTNTNIIWQYKKATNNAWTRVGGSISSGVTGVLPVANGGTNASTFTAGSVVFAGTSGTSLTQDNSNLFWNNSTKRLGIGNNNPNAYLSISAPISTGVNLFEMVDESAPTGFLRIQDFTSEFASFTPGIHGKGVGVGNNRTGLSLIGEPGTDVIGTTTIGIQARVSLGPVVNAGVLQISNWTNVLFKITATGNVGIGTASPAVQLHTTGGVRFAGLASITDLRTDADGDLFNGSDFNLKNSIDTINFGLSDVLKLKPVSFNWNDEARNINEYKSMGFIAQDIMDVIPNAASTMGDGDMQVDYNAIVATLTKAIQEQQALIKALEQRILILENK